MAEAKTVEAPVIAPAEAPAPAQVEAHPLFGKTVIVTGADSFLGRAIFNDLCTGNVKAYPVSRSNGQDFRDEVEVLQAMLMLKPDIVIHVPYVRADGYDPGYVFGDIVSMGRAIIDACAISGTKLVIAREEGPNLLTAHNAVFEMAEAYKKQFSRFDCTSVCFPELFGPGDVRSWEPVQQIAEIAIRGAAMGVTDWFFPGKGGGEIVSLYVADAVRAVVAEASEKSSGSSVVVGPNLMSVDEVVKEALIACGQNGSFTWTGESGPWDEKYPGAHAGKATRVAEAVKATVAWRAARLVEAAKA